MNAKSAAATAGETDVNDALTDAESMLAQAANATGEKAAELRDRAMQKLQLLRERMDDARDLALRQSKAAALKTDEFVHDHPWRSILAAASVGVVVGLLIGRR